MNKGDYIQLKDEKLLAWGLVILSALIYATLSQTIGVLYGIMALAYMIKVETDLKHGVEFIRQPQKMINIIARVIVLMFIWILISTVFINALQPILGVNIFSVSQLKLLSVSSSTNVLSIDNPLIKFIVYVFYIPAVETPFFLSVVLIFWAGVLSIPVVWNMNNLKMLKCSMLVGLSSVAIHILTILSLQLVNTIEIILLESIPYFLFFTISSLVVFKYKQFIEAMLWHIALNFMAMFSLLYKYLIGVTSG